MFVLELDPSKQFEVVGITIMLANSLQEQDPTVLSIYENVDVLSSDLLRRHQHYLDNDSPDLDWLQLTVSLNKDNPLTENWFAPFIGVCEINTAVLCDNMLLAVMVGTKEKTCINFNIERENLEKVMKDFFDLEVDINEQEKMLSLKEIHRKLL